MPNDNKPEQAAADQPKPSTWEEFFAYMRTVDIPEDWMKDRPMNRIDTVDRTLFSDEDEVLPRKRTQAAAADVG